MNQEIEELDALLASIPRLVKSGGRVVMLTFHSLEDRKVKQSFQELARNGRARILTRRRAAARKKKRSETNPASRSFQSWARWKIGGRLRGGGGGGGGGEKKKKKKKKKKTRNN